MKSLYEFSDAEIGLIIIGGGCVLALSLCLGLCGLLHSVSRRRRKSTSSTSSKSGIIKEQSNSVLRGDHPIAFVLPSVSMSEPGSEMSDLESLTTSYSTSPSISLTSPFGLSQTPWRNRRASSGYSPYGNHRKNRRNYSRLGPDRGYDSAWEPEADASSLPISSPHIPSQGSGQTGYDGPYRSKSASPNGTMSRTDNEHQEDQLEVTHETDLDQSLGQMRIKINVNLNGDVVISEVFLSDLSTSILSSHSKLAIKAKIFRGRQNVVIESGMTSIFDTKALFIDPIHISLQNEQVGFCLLRLSVVDKTLTKSTGTICYYGHAFLNMSPFLPLKSTSQTFEKTIKSSVVEEMRLHFTHSLEVSLFYDSDAGKLTLGIIQGQINGVDQLQSREVEAYVYSKVTLFEGRRVIKAKKTRPVGFNSKPQFHETFSILFPISYLDRVSCIISLCSKSRQGSKAVLGRVCVGPHDFAEGQGEVHWTRMRRNIGATIIHWHPLS